MKIDSKKAVEYALKKVASDFDKVKITSPSVASQFARNLFGDTIGIYESFYIILLNRAGMTIGWTKISQGGISGTVVDPLLIAKYAIDIMARGVILCHNHPSGNLKPSEQDRDITKKIINGLKLFDIEVRDHIILTEDSYYSFNGDGII